MVIQGFGLEILIRTYNKVSDPRLRKPLVPRYHVNYTLGPIINEVGTD